MVLLTILATAGLSVLLSITVGYLGYGHSEKLSQHRRSFPSVGPLLQDHTLN